MAKSKPVDVGRSDEEWQWKVESAADTLLKAKEVEADAKLHKAALAELKKRQTALGKVLGSHPNLSRSLRNAGKGT